MTEEDKKIILRAVPNAIVVRTPDGWRVAEKLDIKEVEVYGGHRVYVFESRGLPYHRGESAACEDAALILARGIYPT